QLSQKLQNNAGRSPQPMHHEPEPLALALPPSLSGKAVRLASLLVEPLPVGILPPGSATQPLATGQSPKAGQEQCSFPVPEHSLSQFRPAVRPSALQSPLLVYWQLRLRCNNPGLPCAPSASSASQPGRRPSELPLQTEAPHVPWYLLQPANAH